MPIIGTEGNDILQGTSNADFIDGLGGDDFVLGFAGEDEILGGQGNDTLDGGSESDTLDGGAGADRLDGGLGVDVLLGGADDDTLRVMVFPEDPEGEYLDGGDGIDQITFTFATPLSDRDIVFDLTDPSIEQTIDGVTFVNIERAWFAGLDGNDTITGGAYEDQFYGGFGKDRIDGGAGDDILDGGHDADTVLGGAGNDSIASIADDVLIDGGTGDDLLRMDLSAGGGSVTLDISDPSTDQSVFGTTIRNIERLTYHGVMGTDLITGGQLDDLIVGGGGDDVLRGGGGNDTVSGGLGSDSLFGGSGDDFIHSFNESYDTTIDSLLDGGDGFDLLEFSALGSNSVITIDLADTSGFVLNMEQIDFRGGAAANNVFGAGAADMMRGGASEDMFVGRGGDDYMLANGGSDSLLGGDNNDELHAGEDDDHLSGEAHDDALYGDGGHDHLEGGSGNDYLDGGSGEDTMLGGIGNDQYVIDTALDRVVEAANSGTDSIGSSINLTLGANIENLSLLGTALSGAGNALANVLIGNSAANILNGHGGADRMIGLWGNDTYFIDHANDLVLEAGGGGTDRILASVSYVLRAGIQVETLSTTSVAGTAAINFGGNELVNILYGNAGANILNGGGGADQMAGYGGSDQYFVDHAQDLAFESVGGGSDRVFASTSYTLHTGSEVEILSTANNGGTDEIDLTGNEFAQIVYGNAGANVLNGGAGADTLSGFGGADTFAFTTALGGGNVDWIVQFEVGIDEIALDDAVFVGLGLGALSAGAFHTGSAAADAEDRIVYDAATGALFFDADGSGAGAAVQFAKLSTGLALGATDFIVI